MAGRPRLFLVVAGVIVVLVLAAGAGAVYLFRERADSREELARVYAERDLLRGDVEAMSERKRLKADELARHPALATPAEARDFSGRLVSYAAAQDLTIGSFEQAQKTASVGAVDYPAFGYTLVVQGPPEPVIDMLDILHEIGGSRIEALELTRSVEDDSPWDMSLSISVIYATGG